MVSYNLEFSNINEFMLTKKVRTEVLKAKDVLELLLPKFVLKRVKEGIRYIADDQGIVTILFCNICDFDQIIIDYTPQEITSLLDEVYGKFDQLCELVGVTKIETVGKTYMACAGLKDSESELDQNFRSVPHARRVIEMGIEIINSAQKIITRNGECLHVQIGINSGPVTAGVVGSHKPQYSLVGDTVNMASRMASTIKERDAIQISTATYKELSNKRGLLLIPHTVYAKGKGEVETYIVKVDNVPDNLFSEFARRVDTVRHTGTMIGSMLMPTISMHVGSFSDHVCPGIVSYETKRMSGLYTNLVNGQKDKLFKRKESDRKEKMSIINFKCKETEAERNFRKIMLEDNYDSLKCCLIGGIVSNICGVFVHLVWIALHDANTPFFLIFFPLEIIGYIVMLKLLKKYYSFKWFAWMLQLFYSIGTLVLLCSILYIEQNLQDLINTCILYHFLLLTHGSALLYGHIIIFAVFTIGL